MIKFTSVAVVLLALCYAYANLSPEDQKRAKEALHNNKNTIQGDMRLSKDQKAKIRNRVATSDLIARWPGGKIPYVIDSSVANLRGMIIKAAAHIAQQTGNCIKWVPRTFEPNYIEFFKESGCWSLVGHIEDGPQKLSLGDGCEFFGTVVHEMLHAVGFDHEQNRPDRDQYLNIFTENMSEGSENQFDILTDGLVFTNFDWNSVMLYGETAFSKDGVSPTMQDKTGQHRLTEPYDKPGMTNWDAYQVKKFYNCTK